MKQIGYRSSSQDQHSFAIPLLFRVSAPSGNVAGTVESDLDAPSIARCDFFSDETAWIESSLKLLTPSVFQSSSVTAEAEAPKGRLIPTAAVRDQIRETLEQVPLEDGETHPAQKLIEDVLKAGARIGEDWLQQLFQEWEKDRPVLAATLLQCLGRLPRKLVGLSGTALVLRALRSPSVALRDSAVGAIEQWEAKDLLNQLKPELEQQNWLAQYMRQVAADLR